MTAARSIKFFGIYLFMIGVPQLLFPETFYRAFQVPSPSDHTAFILAAVTVAIGFYYVLCAAANVTIFFQATVVGRLFVSTMAFIAVINGMAAPTILTHFTIEFVSALVTAFLLTREGEAPVPLPAWPKALPGTPDSRSGEQTPQRRISERDLSADRAMIQRETSRLLAQSRTSRVEPGVSGGR